MSEWKPIETAKEEWQPVQGWEGLYEVSSLGRVRSLPRSVARRDGTMQSFRGKLMSAFPNGKGYLVVRLSDTPNGRRSIVRVHRLVSMAFIPNRSNLPEINHRDGNKKNNALANLEWCSTKDNAIHAVATGLNRIAKIPRTLVPSILDAHQRGVSCRALARQHNIDRSSMRALLRGETYSWATLPPPPET